MGHWSNSIPRFWVEDEEDFDQELMDEITYQIQDAIDLGEDVAAYAAAVPAGAVLQSRYLRHMEALRDQLQRVLRS